MCPPWPAGGGNRYSTRGDSRGGKKIFWLTQVKGIPTPANICLQLGNVVKMTDSEALNFKKKILRYIHLRLAKYLYLNEMKSEQSLEGIV